MTFLQRYLNQPKINLTIILRQLAGMTAAGLPISGCMEILHHSQQDAPTKNLFYKIRQQILSGRMLSSCLAEYAHFFDAFTCRLIYLGEQTGKLSEILTILADNQEKRMRLHRNIRQILFYPAILLVTSISLSLGMFLFVIPSFAAQFSNTDTPLPLLSAVIFKLSLSVSNHIVLLIWILVITIATMIYYRKTLAAFLLPRIPIVSRCFETAGLVRFIRHLGIALSAGVPILDALQLTVNLCGSNALAAAVRHARISVSAGRPLYQSILAQHCFPLLLKQMIKVGEETGTLDCMLIKTAELMEVDLDSQIKQLTQLLEPLIMAVLGVLIGGLVIGIYLPVFNLGSAI